MKDLPWQTNFHETLETYKTQNECTTSSTNTELLCGRCH